MQLTGEQIESNNYRVMAMVDSPQGQVLRAFSLIEKVDTETKTVEYCVVVPTTEHHLLQTSSVDLVENLPEEDGIELKTYIGKFWVISPDNQVIAES